MGVSKQVVPCSRCLCVCLSPDQVQGCCQASGRNEGSAQRDPEPFPTLTLKVSKMKALLKILHGLVWTSQHIPLKHVQGQEEVRVARSATPNF